MSIPLTLATKINTLQQAAKAAPASGTGGGALVTVPPLAVAGALPVDAGQSLNLRLVSAVANATYGLAGLTANSTGTITPFSYSVTVALSGTLVDTAVPLPAGTLLALTLSAVTTSVLRGNTWAQVWLQAGINPGGTPLALLIADYVGYGSVVGWPGVAGESSLGPTGALSGINRSVAVASSITWLCPAYQQWEVISAQVTLSVGGANPAVNPIVQLTDSSGHIVWQASPVNAVAPGSGATYLIAPGVPLEINAPGYGYIPIPAGVLLNPSWTFGVYDLNSGANNWSGYLNYQQFMQP